MVSVSPDAAFAYLCDIDNVASVVPFIDAVQRRAPHSDEITVRMKLGDQEEALTVGGWIRADETRRTVTWGVTSCTGYRGEWEVTEIKPDSCLVSVRLRLGQEDSVVVRNVLRTSVHSVQAALEGSAGGVRRSATDAAGEEYRYLVVDGRRWRRADPELPRSMVKRLLSHLGRARSQIRLRRDVVAARARVQLAKEGLGERGTPWWELSVTARLARAHDALASLDALAPPGPSLSPPKGPPHPYPHLVNRSHLD